jgi:hypothetical protein
VSSTLVVVPVSAGLCEPVTLLAMPFCGLAPTGMWVGKIGLTARAHTLSRSADVSSSAIGAVSSCTIAP